MNGLKGYQKRYLRGLAHKRKPEIFVGHKGLTQSLIQATDQALDSHALVKIKFVDEKGKEGKAELVKGIEAATGGEVVGIIGHTAILFRQNKDPEKRKIAVPEREHGEQ